MLTGLDFYIFKRSLSKNVDKAANKLIMTHQKKLEKLTRNTVLPFTSDETVTNISSARLTQEQLGILKLGLNHSICPPKISKSDVFSCFELIHHTMLKNIKDSKMAGKLATDLSHLAHSYVSTFHPSNKDTKTHKILKELLRNKNIAVLKPDKGNGVVVLNKSDYNTGLRKIIDDPTKFKPLENDPTAQREAMLQRFLRKLKTNGHLDDVTYGNIYPTGSQPARIYGLPKMQKTRAPNTLPPFRPIISSIGTYNYKLAKYLCSLLQPHIPF